ncbi:hypothetical protein GGI09_002603 [Coemansia sp. S100]|nr:hypothetical protein LPJ71_003915 [Coemansia sp. S17]KAJ2099796.1 hypothetical protein GGI09_002603 [Coemansia sp. S100]
MSTGRPQPRPGGPPRPPTSARPPLAQATSNVRLPTSVMLADLFSMFQQLQAETRSTMAQLRQHLETLASTQMQTQQNAQTITESQRALTNVQKIANLEAQVLSLQTKLMAASTKNVNLKTGLKDVKKKAAADV